MNGTAGQGVQMGQFEREYFIQTRKEIDVEKQERDRLLNFATAFVGIVMAGLISAAKDGPGLMSAIRGEAFPYVACAVLVVISTLIWVRAKKLTQIADRWCVLRKLLLRSGETEDGSPYLEFLVVRGLRSVRYATKDALLNISLSIPVYLGLFLRDRLTGLLIAATHLVASEASIAATCLRWRRRTLD